jgi:hypothetical protein
MILEECVTQRELGRILGRTRVSRMVRAKWLAPAERTPARILYRVSDVHAALRRLERERCPPDKIEIARVRLSEVRNGRGRVRKVKLPRPTVDAIELDWSGVDLNGVNL